MHVVMRFRKHGLALDVDISWVDVGSEKEFPIIRPTDMISFLAESGNLSKLAGGITVNLKECLQEFWRRYSRECPDHGVYGAAADGEVALSRCFPCYLHGDEGRGLKKSGVMLLSLQGAIGEGSSLSNARLSAAGVELEGRMGLNLGGPSFNSRLLYASMPKSYYKKNPVARMVKGSRCFKTISE